MKTAIYISDYYYNPFGDGGFKRTSQIYSLLNESGYKIEFKQSGYRQILPSKFKKLAYIFSRKGVYTNVTSLSKKYNIEQAIKHYTKLIKDYDLIVWDCGIGKPNYDYLLPIAAKAAQKKIIAICHNLDSLVPSKESYLSGQISPNWLNEELKYLRECNLVITISREENWLLKLHQINSAFIPYDPNDINELYNSLMRVKEKRRNNSTSSSYLLVIGTVLNPPTYQGTFELLSFFQHKNYHVKVAGYGTESLVEFNNHTISILGSVDQNQLEDLLINCKAVVINTQWSSGALTKIPELMVCGIPILANEPAARTFYNAPSIFEFSSLEELEIIIETELSKSNSYDLLDKNSRSVKFLLDKIFS